MKPKMAMDEKPPAVIITESQAYTVSYSIGVVIFCYNFIALLLFLEQRHVGKYIANLCINL